MPVVSSQSNTAAVTNSDSTIVCVQICTLTLGFASSSNG